MRTACNRLRLQLATYFLLANVVALAQSPYSMEGVVTDAETGQPVANTTVRVCMAVDEDRSRGIRKGVTDKDGRYAIELPPGHAFVEDLMPPVGYSVVGDDPTESFATSDDHPIFTKNYQVRKGFPIQVVVRCPEAFAALPNTVVSLSQQKQTFIRRYCELGEDATGVITLPELAGKYEVQCVNDEGMIRAPEGMAADFEDGFDPDNVLPDVERQESDDVIVRDANGFAAKLTKCAAIVRDKQLTIAIDVEMARPEIISAQLHGRVVDVNAVGIAGATVDMYFHSNGTSSIRRKRATTDNNGEYSVDTPTLNADQKIFLMIDRTGFSEFYKESMGIAVAANGDAIIEPVTLEAGYSVPIRVVGPDGTPLHGAVVQPRNKNPFQTPGHRTDPIGQCLLTDLPPGVTQISAQFGTLYTFTFIPVEKGENEIIVLKLLPTENEPYIGQPLPLLPLAPGLTAPAWTIGEWSDGQDRKLSEYRGKIVVLQFWDISFEPCIYGIPAMKELDERYDDKDVVFLAINKVGSDLNLVRRFLKQQDWNLTVGLDSGDEILAGASVFRYAIVNFPTVIVVDRKGSIAFNSGYHPRDHEARAREMEAAAKSAGLPWPIDEGATQEKLLEWWTQLQKAMLGRRIDEALEKQPE